MMSTAFLDMQGPLLLEFKEPDVSINAQWYTQTLDKLHKAIKNNRPSMLWPGVIILCNNARPHVTKVCVEALTHKSWEVLEHPAYSPDLSPCDDRIFEPPSPSLG
ncbi:histone-lysine N-methyltransferase SETMAR [Trichonephila inaurata madagascariensis]|uniref:Histone-lysine N-methyltransferase SETMAR n=1 Tax=Trichonephila inaurata madagascariensis TaxID=2747483 RepID=A0A8X6JI62_9ARAC|nr:histone-lysine N-methyltransferase SETMAR [Trichonephila inaurata madagascariensis]